MTTFDFNEELKKGKQGEKEFYEKYKPQCPSLIHLCERGDVTSVDFILNGKGVEVKSDKYPLTTENYFIERYSNIDVQSPGGPWQAKKKGADYFVYHYLNTKYYAWFSLTDSYFEVLEDVISKLDPVRIPNKTWTTVGYKVNRDNFLSLLPDSLYAID